ncbi:MAG: outer membrane protein transport protein [Candidatus Omnitrophica bacterium]|nr:outer membrane protein transport protein [Candidatus Omnitrophota bacterium]
MKKYFSAFLILTLLFLGQNPAVYAVGSSGFENASYSAKTLGQANAVVARPQDPSTISFNPAGIVDLPGVQVSAGLEGLDWRILHTSSVTGDKNQNNGRVILIPSFYVTANPGELLDNRVAFGLAVNSPFGLSSKFPSIGMGRYTGYKNSLQMVATTMATSARLTNWLNVGGGATHYWIYDYGQSFNYPNAALAGSGGDGQVLTETSGHGWGWNLGLLLKPVPHHKFGASFRSQANVKVNGRVVLDDLVNAGSNVVFDTLPHFESGAHSNVPLPWNFTLGYAYEPSEKWAVENDFGITGWSVFADQDFGFDRPNATLRALGTVPRDYDTTFSYHLGGHRQLNDKTDLLGGFAFYQAAAPKNHVDNFLPDANRFLWTAGTSYNFSPRARIDFSYIFMLFARRSISNPAQVAKTGTNIDGRYTSILHGAFVTFTYSFDFPFEKKYKDNKEAKVTPIANIK